MHTLGTLGNFAISDTLQSVLTNYGLQIHHDGEKGYAVKPLNGSANIDQLCPETIERDGDVFDIANLKRFAEFLHQPIRSSLEETVPETEKPSGFRAKSKQRSQRDAAIHQDRTSIHRMLRFAATQSVEIPPDDEENLEKESAECHAETEQAMRDADTWKSEIEFGNPEQKISSLPNTAFNADKGFTLQVTVQNPQEMAEQQRNLDSTFWSLLNEATDGRYTQAQPEITLSGAELQKFSTLANNQDLASLIDRVEFEEAVQEKLESIQQRTKSLSGSKLLGESTDKSQQLHTLMQATSALTPVLDAEFMRDAWAKYNFTQRHASPLEGLQKEMAVFLSIAEAQIMTGQTSPAQMEAIATEFYSLIAFSGHITEALNDGLEKESAIKAETQNTQPLQEELHKLKNVFDHASIAGVRLDADFLSDEQRDALETLQKYAGKPENFGSRARSVMNAPLKAGGETFVDFAGDVVNFIREDPKIAAGFVGLATALIVMKGGDPAAADAASYAIGLEIGDDGSFSDVPVNAENVPSGIFGDKGYHWDLKFSPLKGYELYKHFANSNFIVGPSQQFMEFTRSAIHGTYGMLGIPQNYESAYDGTANAVIKPLADKLFAVNMFQNVSHAAFWIWAGARGYQHGTKGVGKLMELSAPVVDLAYQAGSSIPETFKKKTAFSDHLMQLSERPLQIEYQGQEKPKTLIEEIADTAEMRADLPKGIEKYAGTLTIDAMKTPVECDGLKRNFNISAQNLQTTLDALAKFDHFMQHVATHVASHESWHVNTLISKIKNVQDALHDYQISGDTNRLDQELNLGLEYILASELRYRDGKSDIYEALFEAAPDKKALTRLLRSANTTIGQEKRSHAKSKIKQDIFGQGEAPLKLTGHAKAQAKLAGINLWGGMVNAAKSTRRITDRTLNKRNVIIGTGIAATCVGLDMAGTGNEFSNAVSGITGGSLATGTTVATFLNFNFWEDIVGVHLGTGISLVFAGAVAGVAHKKYIKPTINCAAETKAGSVVGKAWNISTRNINNTVTALREKMDRRNVEWGDSITKRMQPYSPIPVFQNE